jgi:hypothetical protein
MFVVPPSGGTERKMNEWMKEPAFAKHFRDSILRIFPAA